MWRRFVEADSPFMVVVIVVQGMLALLFLLAAFAATGIGELVAALVLGGILAGLAVHNAATLATARRLRRQGALTVDDAIASAHGTIVCATLWRGSWVRRGLVLIVDGVAAFVPLTRWQSPLGFLGASLSHGVFRTRMLHTPRSAAELYELVCSRDGLILDAQWQWTALGLGGSMLVHPNRDRLDVRLSPAYARRWEHGEPGLDAHSGAAGRRLVGGLVGGGALLLVAGALAWWLLDDSEYFVAALWYAVVLVIPAILVLVLRWRGRRTPARRK